MTRFILLAGLAVACTSPARRAPTPPLASASSRDQLVALLLEADTDGDGRITVLDRVPGRAPWAVKAREGVSVPFQTPFRLAHVADLLARDVAGIEPYDRARAGLPRHAIVRGLVDRSWEPLVRRADNVTAMAAVLRTSRVRPADGKIYIYFPESDAAAGERLRAEAAALNDPAVQVVALPRALDAAWLDRLDRQPGLLYLPAPYIVPGGHFVEMYGWDSYFMGRGALAAGRADLALALLENFIYQIERYGKIGNSNRSFHRGRTQPPFLPRLALAIDDAGAFPAGEREAWLRRAASAGARELDEVWGAAPRFSTQTGLSRYHDEARGPLPEVRRETYKVWRDDQGFIDHQRAVRESGWDMTLRFGDRGHQMVPVCLNALLYGVERDLAELHHRLGDAAGAERFEKLAVKRKGLADQYLWDEKAGLYFDWDLEKRARTDYETVANYYALFTGLASPAQAKRIATGLQLFLEPGGLAVSSKRSRMEDPAAEQLQWDWPFGWAPHQVIAVEGLRRYGFTGEADEVATRWLSLVIEIAGDHNGLIVEKYDVANRSAEVTVEYGNQGRDRGALARYRDAPECKAMPRRADCVEALLVDDLRERAVGFGWTNASVALLYDGLSEEARRRLAAARP